MNKRILSGIILAVIAGTALGSVLYQRSGYERIRPVVKQTAPAALPVPPAPSVPTALAIPVRPPATIPATAPAKAAAVPNQIQYVQGHLAGEAAKTDLRMLNMAGAGDQIELLIKNLELKPDQQVLAVTYFKARDQLAQTQSQILQSLEMSSLSRDMGGARSDMSFTGPMSGNFMTGRSLPGFSPGPTHAMRPLPLDAQITSLDALMKQMKQTRDLRLAFFKSLTKSQTDQLAKIPDMDLF